MKKGAVKAINNSYTKALKIGKFKNFCNTFESNPKPIWPSEQHREYSQLH